VDSFLLLQREKGTIILVLCETVTGRSQWCSFVEAIVQGGLGS
jgi:hypothetical protein